ncbi:MAG: hypothetical protein KFB93_03940 [Simkaniaceae bacterium]|nr:MAG: hypothetical protein KFB93_03940 [Simkaniaceae bacterium]
MTICIEVALKAEATPLIEALNLKPLSGTHLFPIYENEGIKLIVSGVGKIKAGAACAYLAGIHRDEDIYGWLNVGVGGHRSLKLGTPLLVNKIVDGARKAQYFPSFAFDPPCRTEECITIENPDHGYPTNQVYDMEAAGFYAIASKISPIEMIHVFKVISDNRAHPAKEVTKKEVHSLIYNHVDLIRSVISEMHILIDEIAPEETPFLDEFIKRWHFTTLETLELRKLLQRWHLLCADQILLSRDLLEKKTAEEVLSFIKEHIEAIPVKI